MSPPRSTHRRDSNQKHDYRDVDPRFGTLAELDALLAAAHARGLKIILEFAPNHTSDAHRWFRAARTSRDDEQRDWYLWRDAARDGGPPSTWLAHFGDSARESLEAFKRTHSNLPQVSCFCTASSGRSGTRLTSTSAPAARAPSATAAAIVLRSQNLCHEMNSRLKRDRLCGQRPTLA